MSDPRRAAELFLLALGGDSPVRAKVIAAATVSNVTPINFLLKHVEEIADYILKEKLGESEGSALIKMAMVSSPPLGSSGATWSPQPRKASLNKKAAFLEALREVGGMTTVAIRATGISQSLPYAWARNDPAFKEEWNVIRREYGLEDYQL